MTIDYEKRGAVAFITLNRPGSLNAINAQMHARLREVWRDFAQDEGLNVAVLSGAGRAFCAGMDLRERVEAGRPRSPGPEPDWPDLMEIPKPIICAVNGNAAGGGVGLVLQSDIALAVPEAEFVLPFAARGLSGGRYPVQLAKKLSPSAALWLTLTSQRIDAATALRLGLVHELVPAPELMERATYLAEKIAGYSQLSLRALKDRIIKSLDLPYPEAIRYMSPYERQLQESQDHIEGPRAFVEKRRARFEGQ